MLQYEPFAGATVADSNAGDSDDTWSEASAARVACPQRLSQAARVGVLLAADLLAVMIAAMVGYLSWACAVLHQPPALYVELAPLLCLVPLSYSAIGLTPGFGVGAVETLRRLFRSTSVCFLAFAATSFVFKANPAYSRMSFLITWAMTLAAVPLLRFVVLSRVSGFRWWGDPTVVVGDLPQAELTIRSVAKAFSLGYHVVGVLLVGQDKLAAAVHEVPVLGGLELAPALSRQGVSTVLVWDSPGFASTLEFLQEQFRHVVVIREEKLLPVEHVRIRNLGGVLGIDFMNQLSRRRNRLVKRAADLIFGSAFLLAGLPLILIGGIAIKMVSKGPMFFSQEREGDEGRKFRVWKLRTMCADAEQRLKEVLDSDPVLREQWHNNIKLDRDPRVIPSVGSFLRRSSIDELPQLWSVIKGDMSLVGPRPLPAYHLNVLPEAFRKLRGSVRPGLTGLWQVMIRSSGRLEDQVMYDTYYIRNWSPWLDAYVLARTIFAVLSARGAS